MKQILHFSLFLAFMLMGGNMVFAEDFTFNATDIQDVGNKDVGNTATSGTFTFTAVKNNGSTAPAFNANGQDVRLYAKNTLTITNSAGNMTKVVFTISTQGKRRLAEITASTGIIATPAEGDETVTWTGDAAEVTFTVGDKAVYGTDGADKAGQFDFTSLVITATNGEGGSDDTPNPDPEPTDLQTVDNIAAFKALAVGTEAILKLNNAQVLYVGATDIYLRDNTGAIDLYNTGLALTTGQVLNGSVTGTFTLFNNNIPELTKTDNTNANNITATAGTASPKTFTIAQVKNEANICDLVKITGAKIELRQEGNYTNPYAIVGDEEILLYDKFKLLTGTPDENTTYDVEGILILYNGVYEIYPTKDYTNGQGEEPPVVDPTEVKVPYSIDFTKGQGAFTINDVTLPEGLSYVWANDTRYGMKASGYYQKAYETESWLISPVFDLTGVTAPVLTFSHTGRYFSNMQEEATLWVKEGNGDWQELTIPTWFTGDDWNFVDAQVDLSAFAGKKVTLGFRYTSTEAAAATWEINALSIDEVKEAELVIQGEQEFETSTTVTIIPSNPDNEVYYTIDGTNPIDSKTAIQYTKPFTLTETTTVKAYEEGAELYAEMTFTKIEVQLEEKTIAEINEMTEDLKNVKLVLNNAVVTYVDGANLYIREGDKAVILYNTALPFSRGDVLNGSIVMDYDNYYGIHEMKDNDATGTNDILVTGKETPVPTEVTIPEILALNHKCDFVVLRNVKVVAEGTNYYAEDAEGQRVQLYKGIDVSELVGDGFLYDIEGVFNNIYKNAPEIQPIDATQTVAEGIANVKTFTNGNDKAYNLAGQRVSANQKGIVIVNGKKILK